MTANIKDGALLKEQRSTQRNNQKQLFPSLIRAKTSSLVQVRNSLMKREDEADAEKKKLQNRCNNLEEKSVMLHSENVRHKSCSFNLKPNLERRSGKTRGGAVPCEE